MTRRATLIVVLVAAAAAAAAVAVAMRTRSTPSAPPAPVSNLAQTALDHRDFDWDSLPGPNFTLYVMPGSFGAANATDYHRQLEQAIPDALAMLGESTYPGHMRVFLVSSRAEVEALTGYGYNGWTDAPSHTFFLVATDVCRPVIRHETMHLVSLHTWGHPLASEGNPDLPSDRDAFLKGGWLREGIAATAEDRWLTYSYRGMAAQWQAENALLPLDSLTGAFYRQDDLAAYLQAGTLIQYLLATYGIDPFRQIWRDGPAAFQRAYGKSGTELEAEWHRWLRATPAADRPKSIAIARAEDKCPPRQK